MTVSIIIINYKSVQLLKKLVASIRQYNKALSFEFIIVNNWPAEVAELRAFTATLPDITLIEPAHNLYFAPSINLAAREAHGEYLAFLNVDMLFFDNSLERLVDFLDSNFAYAATVGTMIDEDTNAISPSTNQLPTLATELIRHTGLSVVLKKIGLLPRWYTQYLYGEWDRQSDKDVEAGCDAFLVIRKRIFMDTGGYSAGHLMYLTEEDLGRKLKRHTYKMRYIANAKVIHKWSHSTKQVTPPKIQAIMLWDRYVYFRQRGNAGQAWLLVGATLVCNPHTLRNIFPIIDWIKKIRAESADIERYISHYAKANLPA